MTDYWRNGQHPDRLCRECGAKLRDCRCSRHRMTDKEPLEPDNDKLTVEALKLVVKEMTAKIQHLVDEMDMNGRLEDHAYTFPDGDIWKAQDVEPPKTS